MRETLAGTRVALPCNDTDSRCKNNHNRNQYNYNRAADGASSVARARVLILVWNLFTTPAAVRVG